MTDPTPQSSTPSQTLSQEGLGSAIGKAFKEVEACENKAWNLMIEFLIEKNIFGDVLK